MRVRTTILPQLANLNGDPWQRRLKQRGYAHPDALVSTDWVEQHLNDPNVRVIESNEDTLLYASGHVPGAVHVDWTTDLNDQIRRDYITREGFEALMSQIGATPDTTVVFYGDKNNWWACYAFWVFQLFGHTNAKVMDGGRLKWEKEERATSARRAVVPEDAVQGRTSATTRRIAPSATRCMAHLKKQGQLVDVRSPEEYAGTRMHMPDYPNEGALRGGHIPGAKSVPWAQRDQPRRRHVQDGGGAEEAVLRGSTSSRPTKETIAYCRIGERSSHTWFALKYLLGFKNIRNYDGSWTEWGNMVGVPIEK